MTLKWHSFIQSIFYHLFIHSLTHLRLLMGKENCFLFVCIWAKPNEGRRVLNPHTDWDNDIERRMQKMLSLSFSLSFSTFCYVSYFLVLFFIFLSSYCLSAIIIEYHLVLQWCSSSCFAQHPSHKDSEIKEKGKSNLNAHTYDSLLLFVTSSIKL